MELKMIKGKKVEQNTEERKIDDRSAWTMEPALSNLFGLGIHTQSIEARLSREVWTWNMEVKWEIHGPKSQYAHAKEQGVQQHVKSIHLSRSIRCVSSQITLAEKQLASSRQKLPPATADGQSFQSTHHLDHLVILFHFTKSISPNFYSRI